MRFEWVMVLITKRVVSIALSVIAGFAGCCLWAGSALQPLRKRQKRGKRRKLWL